MAIVLAEVQTSSANVLVSFERSFAASSSVRHRAGLQPRHCMGQKGLGAEPPCDHSVGAEPATHLWALSGSTHPHVVLYMSPSPVNNELALASVSKRPRRE